MTMSMTFARSEFIRLASSSLAGLTLVVGFEGCARMQGQTALAEGTDQDFTPNVWLTVHPDNTLTVTINKSEMGQGVATGLPTLVADELDFPFDRVAVEFCIADPKYVYPDGRGIGTGGSTSMRTSWLILRRAGATARAMLVQAAAKAWNVDPATLTTSDGSVIDPASKRRATYGSLAAAASRLPIPADVELKKPEQWNLIGKASTRRTDVVAKTNGSAKFGMDVVVPGMRYAALARPTVVGGKVKSFDARRAKAVKGVIDVVQVPQGVAVIADNTWAAFKGKAALVVEFDDGPNAGLNSSELFAQAERLAKSPSGAKIALTRGDAAAAVGKTLEAIYRGPYLAHAAMEPWNATADVRADACEVWVGTQQQTGVQNIAAQYSGLPLEKCVVHTTFLGGGFGGRSAPDPAGEAVAVSKAIKAPVKVVYTREDDMTQDHYRPMSVNAVRGVLDPSGTLIALTHTVASQAVNQVGVSNGPGGIDRAAINGVANMPYDIPNVTAA
jgi:isoquinoline 1-oxidoreductase subunit beta